MEKRLRLFCAHSRIFLWRSEVIELLKSLRHGCEVVRHRRKRIIQKLLSKRIVLDVWCSGMVFASGIGGRGFESLLGPKT